MAIQQKFNSSHTNIFQNSSVFGQFNLVAIETLGHGSCFFHAIANAYFIPYRTQILNGRPINRRKFIEEFRIDLAKRLSQPVDESNPDSPIYYDVLSRGNLRQFDDEVSAKTKKYTLKGMQEHLVKNRYVDNVYLEFVSEVLNKDIYLLDYDTKNVYIFGDDSDILYKGRDSIVLLIKHQIQHYELVGLQNRNQSITTLFAPDHSFITAIKNQYIDLSTKQQ
jgi:hypothetical protein